MGYESKLYIVEKGIITDENNMRYARVIAMFDMCKIADLISVFESETDCYFYADDGNTKILEDRYGDKLKEATVKDVLYTMEEALDNGETYRRIFPLVSTLRTIYEQQRDYTWGEIVVLHYGY
jgi:hypothetical protein